MNQRKACEYYALSYCLYMYTIKQCIFFNEVVCIFFYMTPSLSTSLNIFPSVIYFVLNLCYEELILSGYRRLKCSFVLHLAFNKSVNS